MGMADKGKLRQESLGILPKLATDSRANGTESLNCKWKLFSCTRVKVIFAANGDLIPIGKMTDPTMSTSPEVRGKKKEREGKEGGWEGRGNFHQARPGREKEKPQQLKLSLSFLIFV